MSLCDDSTFGLALGLGLGLGLRLGLGLGLGLRLGVRVRAWIRVRVRVYEVPDHLGGARLSADSKFAAASGESRRVYVEIFMFCPMTFF